MLSLLAVVEPGAPCWGLSFWKVSKIFWKSKDPIGPAALAEAFADTFSEAPVAPPKSY